MASSEEKPFDIQVLNWMSAFLYGFFILLVVLGLFIYFVESASLNLRGIIIRGDVYHHNVTSLRNTVVPNLKGNFYTINLSKSKSAFESLPWISKASVKRVFPHQIEVVLQEHRAVAAWGARNDSKMVNNAGLIFDAGLDDEETEGLPQFIGPDDQSELVLNMYRHLIPLLEPLRVKLVKLELSARGSWRVVLEGGALIELGRGPVDTVTERVQRLTHTLEQVVSKFNRNSNALQYADLRHSDGYALKLYGVSTVSYPDKTALVKQAY